MRVYLLKVLLAGVLENATTGIFNGWYVTSGDAGGIGFVVLLLGAAIGLTGSLVGLRRFVAPDLWSTPLRRLDRSPAGSRRSTSGGSASVAGSATCSAAG